MQRGEAKRYNKLNNEIKRSLQDPPTGILTVQK